MYYTYIVQCRDQTLYVGYTNNIEKRIQDHNTSRRGAKYTRGRGPVVLRYVEGHRTLGKALSREAEIKKLTRAKKFALIGTKKNKKSVVILA